jgi:hypothetical protein
MDELQTIREALVWIQDFGRSFVDNEAADRCASKARDALAALARLEALAGEMPDTAELAARIRGDKIGDNHAGMLIGQYAYRYSEDIRKDRDEWKAMAEDFARAIMAKAKE